MSQTLAEQPGMQASNPSMQAFRDMPAILRPWSLKWQVCLTTLTLLVFSAVMIQIWNYKNFLSTEIQRTEEKHLVIAQNVALSLSRYITDASQVFIYLQGDLADHDIAARGHFMMREFGMDAIAILNADSMLAQSTSLHDPMPSLPDAKVLEGLRNGANKNLFGVQVSALQQLAEGKYFILGYNLPEGALAIAWLNTRYIKSLQERIVFGENGHSAIFDATGRAVAHPSPTVEENMMDASGISIVALMLERKEGVGTFHSPPMDRDMIAGYTFVPETGWPVMVPQPFHELSDAVHANLLRSYAVAALTALFLGFMGWRVASRIVEPIEQFTRSSQRITEGNYAVELPDVEKSSIEMAALNESLKAMIAQVKLSQDRLREALRLEEDESRRKNEFIVIASHELRTPLNGVLGMLSVCRDKACDADLEKYLDLALGAARRLNRIVDNMVAFTEASANQMKISPAVFDARTALEALSRGYARRAAARGLAFDFAWLNDADSLIVADPEKVLQLASILLDNAIKFSNEGSIRFFASTGIDAEAKGGATLIMSVRNTGMGMDTADQDRLFQPFAQITGNGASASPFARQQQGIGMGLCIARTMATAMGGFITCSSKQDEGSTFEVRIPVERSARNGSLRINQEQGA